MRQRIEFGGLMKLITTLPVIFFLLACTSEKPKEGLEKDTPEKKKLVSLFEEGSENLKLDAVEVKFKRPQ